jgi:hypothetical protein
MALLGVKNCPRRCIRGGMCLGLAMSRRPRGKQSAPSYPSLQKSLQRIPLFDDEGYLPQYKSSSVRSTASVVRYVTRSRVADGINPHGLAEASGFFNGTSRNNDQVNSMANYAFDASVFKVCILGVDVSVYIYIYIYIYIVL